MGENKTEVDEMEIRHSKINVVFASLGFITCSMLKISFFIKFQNNPTQSLLHLITGTSILNSILILFLAYNLNKYIKLKQ